MTTGMTKDQTSDLTPRAGAPPHQAPVMRRSRSLSELPGSIRVPILKRDNERMRARLEAGAQGLAELKLLREQQQKQMEEVMSSASQRKPSSSQNGRYSQSQTQHNQRRMSTASLRQSSQSLARINEEGDDGSVLTNGRLQDCTNLGASRMGHRRHSSFSFEATRNRRPLCTSDSDIYEQELSSESDNLRKTTSWSSLPTHYRSVSSDSLHERQEPPSPRFTNVQSGKKNQRSLSFCAIPSSSYNSQNFGNRDVGEENIEPKLRRGSIQCEAVLTGSGSNKNLGIFKDVDLSHISTDSPSPLHAVLHGFKANQGRPGRVGGSFTNGGSTDSLPATLEVQRNAQFSKTYLSQKTPQDAVVSNRRAFSETDTLINMSKGASLPTNMNVVGKGLMNKDRNNGASLVRVSARQDSRNSVNGHEPYPKLASSGFVSNSDLKRNTLSPTGRIQSPKGALIMQSPTFQIPTPKEDVDERRTSEGNVFLDDDPTSDIRKKNQCKENMQEAVKPFPAQSAREASHDSSQRRPSIVEPITSPVHEKKCSIASDEGYVTSPPSTPRGRNAQSIVSDSSWISTDLDDTASSCEPSPVHMSRDFEVKATSAQLKRSDAPQDCSKAKLSRRSSDYGCVSGCNRNEFRLCTEPTKKSNDVHKEGTKQKLFRSESFDSSSHLRPFKQTAV